MTDAKKAFDALATKARAKGIKIVSKRTYRPFWKTLDILLKIITLGKAKEFMTHFTTTVGNIIAFPETWREIDADETSYIILRHELKHVDQFKRVGFDNIWFGFILWSIAYLFLPLPVCFAWFRYKFEREAYRESCRATRELGRSIDLKFYIDALTGPDYFWAWILRDRVRHWFYRNCT